MTFLTQASNHIPCVSWIGGWILYHRATWEAQNTINWVAYTTNIYFSQFQGSQSPVQADSVSREGPLPGCRWLTFPCVLTEDRRGTIQKPSMYQLREKVCCGDPKEAEARPQVKSGALTALDTRQLWPGVLSEAHLCLRATGALCGGLV